MEIKKRIKELVPDAGEDFGLAVVLRAIAIKKPHQYFINPHGNWLRWDSNDTLISCAEMNNWNLAHDNYDAQSQETKDFIGTLLGVK